MDQETLHSKRSAPHAEPITPTPLPAEDYYRARPARTRQLGAVLIALGAFWLIGQICSGALGHNGPARSALINQTLRGDRIEMDVGNANIVVQAWDKRDIHVEVFQEGDSADKDSIEVRQDGSTVIVRQPFPLDAMFWDDEPQITYYISLPSNTQTVLQTINGDISIEGVENQITIDTNNGDVELRDLQGNLSVKAGNGDVMIEDGQFRDAAVTTVGGNIHINETSGPLTINSISGDVQIEDASDGTLSVSLTSGDFDYSGKLAGNGTNSIETISGNITINLEDESDFRLDASTITGDLQTDLDLRDLQQSNRSISGVLGTGNTMLKVATTSGDLQIEMD